MPGVMVSSLGAEDRSRYWQTRLAVPLVAEPIVSSTDGDGRITLATVSGDIFQLDRRTLASTTVADEPATWSSGSHGPATDVTDIGGMVTLTCGAGSDRVATMDLTAPRHPSRTWLLPGPLSCPPVVYGGGLLAPSQAGQVFFLDPLSGKNLSEPFQPRLQPGRLPAWTEPVAVGDNEVVISDGRAEALPHCAWSISRRRTWWRPPKGNSPSRSFRRWRPWESWSAASMRRATSISSGNPISPAPGNMRSPAAGRGGHAASATARCSPPTAASCIASTHRANWLGNTPLSYGPLAGSPLAVGDHYILAAAGGVVWRVDGDSGKELGRVDAGQPLATGPVLLGGRILVGGHDGSLHQLTPP